MRALWLADVLRGAGLRVHEVSGWRKRGSSQWGPDAANAAYRMPLQGVVCHATAGGQGARAEDEIRVLLNGSPTAPPPIAQLYLARNGTYYVVASGRCNHALPGWAGPLRGYGNYQLIGIEAGNDNRGERWPAPQLDAYYRGVAAICRKLGLAASRVAGHKEHQPYPPPAWTRSTKSDPAGIDMDAFRRRVAEIEEDDMQLSDRIDHPGREGTVTLGSAWGWTLAHAGDARVLLRDRVLPAMQAAEQRQRAILEAVRGDDSATILARIDEHAAAAAADWAAQAERLEQLLEQAAAERAELAELVRQGQSGEIEAAEVVRLLGVKLTAAAEPADES